MKPPVTRFSSTDELSYTNKPTSTIELPNSFSINLKEKLLQLDPLQQSIEEIQLNLLPIFTSMPPKLLQSILNFRRDLKAPGALLVKNFPIDPRLPDTPNRIDQPINKRTFISEACLLGIAQLLGEAFCYREEKDGHLIHNIFPIIGKEYSHSNEGSASDFMLHTEAAYFRHRPHFLILFCLRSDKKLEAATCVVEASDALGFVRHADLEELRKPQFIVHIPESFKPCNFKALWSKPRPIFSGPLEIPEFCLNLNCMRSITLEGQKALDALRCLVNAPNLLQKVYLQPGDILLIENRKAVHGRHPFSPNFDGKDRWLQRVYVRGNLWDGRLVTPNRSRILAALSDVDED